MDIAASASTYRHTRLRIQTAAPTDFVDVTEDIQDIVDAAGIELGLVVVQSLHTTTAVFVNEHEPQLLNDFRALLERLAPERAVYRHDDVGLRAVNMVLGERPNGHAHCRALGLNTSVCLTVAGGRIQLGRWQRIFLAELDGPRSREMSVLTMGEAAR